MSHLPSARGLAVATAAVGVVLAVLTAPVPCRAADPFYDRLLRDGTAELERGDFAAAEHDLRIAAFGLLDEPARLVAALVPLALAQAGSGDNAAFTATFGRIAEVETRFGAYSAADLPAGQRADFEAKASTLLPVATLERVRAFRELARRRHEDEIARLPRREQRAQLESLVADDPAEPHWALALARLELADGNGGRAAELADGVLTGRPDDPEALCLRGRARADGVACADAVADLDACAEGDAEVAHLQLDCLARLGRWSEAQERLDALPPAVRADRSLAKLARQIGRRAAAEEKAAAAAAEKAAGEPPVAGDRTAAEVVPPANAPGEVPDQGEPVAVAVEAATPASPKDDLDDADRETLTTARAAIGRARAAGDLAEVLRAVRDVADRNPDSAEAQYLAGEIAYRGSRWAEAAEYFRRGGVEVERPELRFYMAVSFYEVGDLEAARSALAGALAGLKRTPFVERYVAKILPTAN